MGKKRKAREREEQAAIQAVLDKCEFDWPFSWMTLVADGNAAVSTSKMTKGTLVHAVVFIPKSDSGEPE